MGDPDTSAERPLDSLEDHGGRSIAHPGWDLLLYILDYAVQLMAVFSTKAVIGNSDATDVKAGIMMLLFSVSLLSAEFATDAFDDGAIAAGRRSLVWKAFWGLAVAASADFLLFVLLACMVLPDALLTCAWILCLVTSFAAPLFLLKYQFDRFLDSNSARGRNEGGV